MDDDKAKLDQCKADIAITRTFRDEIPAIVDELVSSCVRHDCFDHVGPEPIPSREANYARVSSQSYKLDIRNWYIENVSSNLTSANVGMLF